MNSRLPDLSSGREIAIWCVSIVAILLVSFRATVVMRRYWSRREHHYPARWTSRQVRFLETSRSYIGAAVIVTWVMLLAVSPFLPMRYPFSQSNAVLFIMLLVQTYAFLVMVAPQDWNDTPIASLKFGHLLGGVVLWWTAFLGLTLYMMGKLAAPRILQVPQMVTGAFA